MRYLRSFHRSRAVTFLLVAAVTFASALLATGTAQAAACGGAVAAGTTCTVTGTMSLGAGTLSMTSPTALGWTATITGVDQQVNDTTAADQGYTVDDATGSAPGWHSTVSATTFTTGGGTPHTLADAGTFSTNGSVTSISGTGAPTAACASGSTCTVPTNTTTYPVAITTAAATPTAFTIYDTSAGTGSGTIDIGGSTAANPVGWWLNMPANTPAGTYTSTITLELISGP
jgi:hypothetical protein